MNDTNFYINEIKRVQGVKSDYAVAKLLNVRRQAMTEYKNGRATFDSDMALKVAKLTGRDAAEILPNMKAQKTKCPLIKEQWLAVAEKQLV